MPDKKFVPPKTLGECADKLFTLNQKRLSEQRKVDLIEVEERALKEYIINTLPKSEASGVAGRLARVTVVKKTVPQVEDWDKFYAHVKKTGEFELMGKRLSTAGVVERWEAGKKVPGVIAFQAVTVSINKV